VPCAAASSVSPEMLNKYLIKQIDILMRLIPQLKILLFFFFKKLLLGILIFCYCSSYWTHTTAAAATTTTIQVRERKEA